MTAPAAPHLSARPPHPLPPPEPQAVDPDLPARAGVYVAAGAVLVQTVAHLVNGFVFDLDLWHLRADVDANVFAWASSMAIFACAPALLLLAALEPVSARLFLFLAAATTFLSADDIGQIHEEIAVVARRAFPDLGDRSEMIWPVLYLPLLIATVVGLVRVLRRGSPIARRVGFVGLPVLGLAVLVDGIWPLFHGDDDESVTTPDLLVDAFEEGLELGGWILVASALAAVALRAARPGGGGAR